MIELALASHIPMDVWEHSDDATLTTAISILDEWNRRHG